MSNQLTALLQERILMLDGAMGTMIQQHPLEEADFRGSRFKDFAYDVKGNNDLLTLTRPDLIQSIHEAYLDAGADIIETNTFNSNSISMADYHMEDLVHELNVEGARLARQACDKYATPDKPRFVAGAMGPTSRTASISPDVNDPSYRAVTFDQLRNLYYQQAKALLEGGVDIFLVETIFDTLNAKAALFALEDLFEEIGKEYPIMVSGTITDASGRTLSGQTTEAFLISMQHAPLMSIGLNCALGAKELLPYLQVLDQKSNVFISTHPNAGLPNEFGQYDESPEQMAEQVQEFLELGLVNILGGCCGTTEKHIAALSKLAKNYKPRKIAVAAEL